MGRNKASEFVVVGALCAVLLAVAGCGTGSRPPAISAEVEWSFSEGQDASGWTPPSPNIWTTDIRLRSNGSRVWTVVPDLLFIEEAGSDSLTRSLVAAPRTAKRDACVPFLVDDAPDDASGEAYRQVAFPAGDDRYTVIMTSADAHWKVNDEEQHWKEIELGDGELFECEWDYLSATTFSSTVRGTDVYQLSHLGPIVYLPDDPATPAYLLYSKADQIVESEKGWSSSAPEFIPLTAETLLTEINNPSRSTDWRVHFLVMSWDQPRPVTNATEILATVAKDESYPVPLRQSAARGLLELEHEPAKEMLVAIARDRSAEAALRRSIVRGMHLLLNEDEIELPAAIATDDGEETQIREAALQCLSEQGAAAWSVIESLQEDHAVQDTVSVLLAEKEQEED